MKLRDGYEIPQLGFGVFRMEEGEQTANAVQWAIEAGYRHIDTAKIYGNERSTGEGIRRSGIRREELFLTTKLWNEDIRQGRTREAFEESLEALGVNYLDLYLIHWPVDREKREKAWLEMVELQKEGRVRSIGVCNFHQHHLEELAQISDVVPAVNQIESNPYFQNQALIDYCQKKAIPVEVWSPLGGSKTTSMREDPVLQKLADKYGKSVTQIIIRWHLQRNVIVLPKTTHKERIIENFKVFDFTLSDEDCKAIAALDRNERVGSDPDNFNF